MSMLRTAGAVLAVLLPLVLLFDPHVNFTYDWHNHQWMVGYFGEYFRQHHAMPQTLNIPAAVGMPQPVFYGFLLYPLLGLIAAGTGAAVALRIGAMLALAAEFAAVYVGARRTVGNRWASFTLAVSSAWSVYGLTNLYSRSALTEFFATAFFTGAAALAVAAVAQGRDRGRLLGGAALLFVLAFGSHPPTALVGTLFFAILLAAAAPFCCRGTVWHPALIGGGVVVVAVGLLMVAPWVVANLHVRGELGIIGKYQDIHVASDRADAWTARFAPVPYDPLPFAQSRHDTPYLEAPINWALLLIAAWNAWLLSRRGGASEPVRSRRRALSLTVSAWAVFAVAVAITLSQSVADVFRVLGPYVQFATRFVSFANAAVLVAALASGAILRASGVYAASRRATSVVLAIALAVAAVNLGVKLRHSASIREWGVGPQYAWTGDRGALVTAGRADAAADYAAVRIRPMLRREVASAAQSVSLPVGAAGAAFGAAGDASVRLAAPGWVVTNVVAFPWNRVWIDGRDFTDAAVVANGYGDAFWLPAGEHRIEWRWEPPTLWRVLTTLSRGLLLLTVVGAFAATVLTFTRRRAPARLPD